MNYKNINDNELLYLISDKNDEYKKILYNKYTPIVKAYAKKYYLYNKDNSVDMDDLVQDGLIALDNAIRFYKEDDSLFYTYACFCIKQAMNKNYKKLLAKDRIKMFLNTSYDDNMVSKDDYEQDIYDKCTISDCFIYLKNKLNFFDSSVFELRYNGFSYKEIAILLDVDVKKIDYSIQKTRRNLKKYL